MLDFPSSVTGECLSCKQAWQNEKLAPELLEPKSEIVESVLDLIRTMEENLSHVNRGRMVFSIHRLELDRIKFVLCSYLRTRLRKIEHHAWHILHQEATRDESSDISRLSPEELAYAKEFVGNVDTHLNSLLLKNMPANFQKMDKKKAAPLPNLESYVFVRAVDRTQNVVIDTDDDVADRDTVDFEPGSQYILPYQPVASLIQSGAARLI